MDLTVFGASGGVGRWVVRLGAERGHPVTAVVRESSAYTPPDGVALVRGEVTDRDFVGSLDLGARTVISCVGQRRAHLFPWSRLLSPPDLVQTVTANLLAAKPGRLIWVSAGGVGDSRARVAFPIGLMIRAGKLATAYADLEQAERLLADAPFPSLAVRPVTLTNGTAAQQVGPLEHYGPTSTIHRRSVAAWMLDAAEEKVAVDGRSVLLGAV